MTQTTLPIYHVIEAIKTAVGDGANVILQAEPGAGKSTVVPIEILKSQLIGDQKIIMLQPRRVAAKSIAHFLASQLNENVGQTVGYRIRNEKKASAHTTLEIVTEGVLTQMIQNAPELDGVGLIIFDEFHERSLHADTALMLAKEVQQNLRDDLRIMIMSATIDSDMLSSYIDNAVVIKTAGRSFPVDVDYMKAEQNKLPSAVVSAIHLLLARSEGDILVFLPGIKEINWCLAKAQESLGVDLPDERASAKAASKINHNAHAKHQTEKTVYELLPLHGSLSLAEQQKALQPSATQKRKIVFATNVAETSLTIPGITGVVDSGLERKQKYDPNSGMSRLITKRISLASAEQRKGRAGRTQQGQCIRLWTETEHQSLEKYQTEEVLNADLTDLLLQLARWGNAKFDQIDWITPPPKAHYESARDLLQSLGMLSPEQRITKLGNEIANLPISPRLAKMIAVTRSSLQRKTAVRLAALLSERDILVSDDSAGLMLRMNVLGEANKPMQSNRIGQPHHSHVNRNAMSAVKELERSLTAQVQAQAHTKAQTLASSDSLVALDNVQDLSSLVACLLLCAFPERLAKRRGNSNRYQLANGKGVKLKEYDPLTQSEWLVVNNCDLREREGVIFGAVAIDKSLLTSVFSEALIWHENDHFDLKTGRFSSERRLDYQRLTLEKQDGGEASTAFIHRIISEQLQAKGDALLNWTHACESWLKRVTWLGEVDDDFPSVTKQSLWASASEWLLPYIDKIKTDKIKTDKIKTGNIKRISELQQTDILPLIKAVLSWEALSYLEASAPEYYVAPSGKKVLIDYHSAQGPTVSIVLQEVFGELTSPKLANKVNLRFELLSPAKRPIQITSDIGQFWHTSYVDVAKDMRSRYPKHRWPTEPLQASPGKSIKPKAR